MRPAGPTLSLFAQWLRPTTNKGKTNPSGLVFFLLPRDGTGTCKSLRVLAEPRSTSEAETGIPGHGDGW